MQVRRETFAACIVSVALVLLATSTAVAIAPAAADRPTLRPNEAAANDSGTAQLGESIVAVPQGDTTALLVTLQNTTNATIVVGGGDADYNVTIGITDGDGDGEVPLDLRTGSVGMQATRFVPTDEGDEYRTLNAAPDPDGTVPVGDYPIAVYAGHGVAGEPTDVGTLVVTEATPPPNASIDRDGATVTLHPRAGQVISGTAELDAGRNVTVRLQSTGGSPFLASTEATVGPDGEFSATFDLSDVDPPANATATVLVDGTRIAGPVEVDVVTRSTTTPGQPGFGVGLALLSLLAGVGMARWFRR